MPLFVLHAKIYHTCFVALNFCRWYKNLSRSVEGRKSVIYKIFQASKEILSLFIFFFLIVYVFAVIAMMFMRDHFDFQDGKPRENFDTFVHAYLSMWIVTTADSWMTILYNAMRVQWVMSSQ